MAVGTGGAPALRLGRSARRVGPDRRRLARRWCPRVAARRAGQAGRLRLPAVGDGRGGPAGLERVLADRAVPGGAPLGPVRRAAAESRSDAATGPPRTPRDGPAAPRGCRYGAAALARESELVRGARPGGRNRTLNRAAFRLGQLVAGGVIDRQAVERALLDAALDCGLGPKEAAATIRSGIEAGLDRPRPSRG